MCVRNFRIRIDCGLQLFLSFGAFAGRCEQTAVVEPGGGEIGLQADAFFEVEPRFGRCASLREQAGEVGLRFRDARLEAQSFAEFFFGSFEITRGEEERGERVVEVHEFRIRRNTFVKCRFGFGGFVFRGEDLTENSPRAGVLRAIVVTRRSVSSALTKWPASIWPLPSFRRTISEAGARLAASSR